MKKSRKSEAGCEKGRVIGKEEGKRKKRKEYKRMM